MTIDTRVKVLDTEVRLLDHGYLRLVETWGSDERIIESACMSTHGSFKGWGRDGQEGDEKLLRFLYENKHMSPFEFAGMVVEVHAPIAVFREWHRHRTQSYNEASARYSPLPDTNYVPTVDRLMLNVREAGANKQAGAAKGAAELTEIAAAKFRAGLEDAYDAAQRTYEAALEEGVPKELARLVLPVGRYSKMRAQANLRNWLAFLTLRMDKAAQWEIRQYANAMGGFIQRSFPRTWALFELGRMA